MRLIRLLYPALLGLFLAVPAAAQDAIDWQTDLEAARKMAAESDRLVLLHFWTPTCQPCMRLERQVFNQPGFAAALEAHYVPVKVNAQANPEIAEQYGVDRWPTDVIVDPAGQMLSRAVCPQDARQYTIQLDRVAAAVAGQQQRQLADAGTPAAGRPTRTSWQRQPEAEPASQSVAPERSVAAHATPPQDDLASYGYDRPPVRRETPPLDQQSAVQPPPRTRLASDRPQSPRNPPLALDGHCPVHLLSTQKWVRGDVRWGAIHRGRTYLFSTEQCQRAFLADPDRYSPVLSGNDPVAAVDEGRAVLGRREFGVFFGRTEVYEGQVYLFSSEETLAIFEDNPERYATAVSRMR